MPEQTTEGESMPKKYRPGQQIDHYTIVELLVIIAFGALAQFAHPVLK